MNNKKRIVLSLTAILVLFGSILALLLTGVIDLNVNVEPVIEEPIVEVNRQPEREKWLKNKNINDDYIGEIVFDSGLVDISFVQATSVYDKDGNPYHFYLENGTLVTDPEDYTGNDVYIWTNWKDMTYDYNILGGSVFVDYRNDMDDENVIIYGHHFSEGGGNDPERIKAFTPLEKLLEEENYKANKDLTLILDNETRKYELALAYQFDINNDFHYDNCQYWRTEYNYDDYEDVYDENYYQNYIDACHTIELYKTDIKLEPGDRTLTLQTCIGGHAGELYEVLVFKLMDTKLFED